MAFESREENFFVRQDRIRKEYEAQRQKELKDFVQNDFAKM